MFETSSYSTQHKQSLKNHNLEYIPLSLDNQSVTLDNLQHAPMQHPSQNGSKAQKKLPKSRHQSYANPQPSSNVRPFDP